MRYSIHVPLEFPAESAGSIVTSVTVNLNWFTKRRLVANGPGLMSAAPQSVEKKCETIRKRTLKVFFMGIIHFMAICVSLRGWDVRAQMKNLLNKSGFPSVPPGETSHPPQGGLPIQRRVRVSTLPRAREFHRVEKCLPPFPLKNLVSLVTLRTRRGESRRKIIPSKSRGETGTQRWQTLWAGLTAGEMRRRTSIGRGVGKRPRF